MERLVVRIFTLCKLASGNIRCTPSHYLPLCIYHFLIISVPSFSPTFCFSHNISIFSLPLSLYLYFSISLYLPVCLCRLVFANSISLSHMVMPSNCMLVCHLVTQSVCKSVCFPACIPVGYDYECMSVCLSVCLFVCLSVCLSV